MTDSDRFYEDDRLQEHYDKRVKELIKSFKKDFKGYYKPVWHDEMIKQMVRCEITIRETEKQIQSGNIIDDTPEKTLQHARSHIRNIWDQLQISMKGQRGDKKTINVGLTKDFTKFAKEKLYMEFNIEVEDEEDDKTEDTI